jgi:hypothetical protein
MVERRIAAREGEAADSLRALVGEVNRGGRLWAAWVGRTGTHCPARAPVPGP